MSNKKIADSIIIRVGGGIREVMRKPLEREVPESSSGEVNLEQAEDMHPFGADIDSGTGISPDKIIN